MSRKHQCSRYEDDLDAQAFVEAHPDGAERAEVGAFFGLSNERIRQIEESGLRKLREALGADLAPEKQTKTDRVRELVAKDVDPSAITKRLGVTIRTVYRARQAKRREAA